MSKGIGGLTERVTLENETRAVTDGGGGSGTYAADSTIWAGIEPISINGRFQNYAAEITASHIVKVRRNEDVVIGSRFLWGTRYLYVRAEMQGDKTYQKFVCEEVVQA